MKKKLTWLVAALLLMPFAFIATHYWTQREQEPWMRSDENELAWLRSEFHLDAVAFAKIKALHAAYEPRCMELCRAILDADSAVARLSKQSTSLTPDLRTAIENAARVSNECHLAMREHLYQVAQAMPPAEGRRFLDMMEPRFQHTAMSALKTPSRATTR